MNSYDSNVCYTEFIVCWMWRSVWCNCLNRATVYLIYIYLLWLWHCCCVRLMFAGAASLLRRANFRSQLSEFKALFPTKFSRPSEFCSVASLIRLSCNSPRLVRVSVDLIYYNSHFSLLRLSSALSVTYIQISLHANRQSTHIQFYTHTEYNSPFCLFIVSCTEKLYLQWLCACIT